MPRTEAPPSKPQPTTKAKPEPAAETPSPKQVSPWVKAFVFFHILAIFAWAVPNPATPYLNGTPWRLRTDGPTNFAQSLNDGFRVWNFYVLKNSPLKFYDLSTGFWQYWDMFAPNPADTDFYGDAVITYQDGSTKIYDYPRMYKLSLFSKYIKERYRKFYERAHSEEYQYLWPQFAQYIALLNEQNPANPPVQVVLQRHWRTVAAPGKPQPEAYQSFAYFTYKVDQAKLNHDAQSQWVTPYAPPVNPIMSEGYH